MLERKNRTLILSDASSGAEILSSALRCEKCISEQRMRWTDLYGAARRIFRTKVKMTRAWNYATAYTAQAENEDLQLQDKQLLSEKERSPMEAQISVCTTKECSTFYFTSTICSWPEQYLRLRKPRGKNWANKGLGRNWPLPRNPDRTSRKQFIFPKQNGKNYPIIGRVRFTGRTTSYYANGDRIPRSIQRRCGWAEK